MNVATNTDITNDSLELQAKFDAISKVQAIIEFNMDGTIITANENFLTTLGYNLNEIQGKHHSLFVEPHYKASSEYREFWEKREIETIHARGPQTAASG